MCSIIKVCIKCSSLSAVSESNQSFRRQVLEVAWVITSEEFNYITFLTNSLKIIDETFQIRQLCIFQERQWHLMIKASCLANCAARQRNLSPGHIDTHTGTLGTLGIASWALTEKIISWISIFSSLLAGMWLIVWTQKSVILKHKVLKMEILYS